MKVFLFSLCLGLAALCWSTEIFAQFSGTILVGVTSSSNVEGVDTSAPDKILQPGVALQYVTQFSPIAFYKFSASSAPYIYTQTPEHTYSSTIFGVGASFYLTNLTAIRAEAEDGSPPAPPAPVAQTVTGSQSGTPPRIAGTPSKADTTLSPEASGNDDAASSVTDSLVANTTSALYLVSGGLDSIEFKGKSADALSDKRDSASEIVSTLADLLDSLTFSQSVKEVALDQLRDVRPLIDRVLQGLKQQSRILNLFDQGVNYLKEAQPESDFMPTQGEVSKPDSASNIKAPTGNGSMGAGTTGSDSKTATISSRPTLANEETEEASTSDEQSAKAPVYTLISATQSFRNLGAQDFDIPENLADLGATTFASTLQLPFSYETRKNQPFYKIYDYNALTLEGTYESCPSQRTSIDLTYDLIRSSYLNDSVYTNTENQLRLGVRTLLSNSTSLILEGILGLKKYSTPLAIEPDSVNKLKKATAVASSFFQYSFGAGLVHTIGSDVSFGGILSFSINPVLRAYVDQLGKLSQRQTTGTSDDQYTYNLSRLMGFVQAKIFLGLMFAVDVAGESRKYGSVVKRVTDNISRQTGADRTERAIVTNVGLTKDFSFEGDRALSLFNDIALTASLGYTSVAAKLPSGAAFPLYSYDDTEIGLSLSLGF